MKIYKLDIDTTKPIRKVIQMQQNSTGALSVDVKNDGWPIRNLSCALYDGETELSSYAELPSGSGYKLDVGDEMKVVKFTAKSTPIECSASYVVNMGTGSIQTRTAIQVELSAGTYRQDEFNNVARTLGDTAGVTKTLYVHANDLSNTNFAKMVLTPWNNSRPVYFLNDQNEIILEDELITVSALTRVCETLYVKRNGNSISSYTYPAIGYWTDYSLDTVIKPSTNAACFAEADIQEPTPEPDPEPEPTPDPEESVEP